MRSSGATTARRSRSSSRFPFTANQWQELEHQALVLKYITSGIPIPPHLLFSIKTSLDSPNSKLMLHHPPNSFKNKNNYGHGMMKDEHPFFSKNVSDSWHLEPLTMGSSKQRNCSNIQNGYSYLQSRQQKLDEQQQYYHEIGLKMEREEDEGDLGSVRSDCPTVWLTLNPARLSDLDDPHSAGHLSVV